MLRLIRADFADAVDTLDWLPTNRRAQRDKHSHSFGDNLTFMFLGSGEEDWVRKTHTSLCRDSNPKSEKSEANTEGHQATVPCLVLLS